MSTYNHRLLTTYTTYLTLSRRCSSDAVIRFLAMHPSFNGATARMNMRQYDLLCRQHWIKYPSEYYAVREGYINPSIRDRIEREWADFMGDDTSDAGSSWGGGSSSSKGGRAVEQWLSSQGSSTGSGSSISAGGGSVWGGDMESVSSGTSVRSGTSRRSSRRSGGSSTASSYGSEGYGAVVVYGDRFRGRSRYADY